MRKASLLLIRTPSLCMQEANGDRGRALAVHGNRLAWLLGAIAFMKVSALTWPPLLFCRSVILL